MPNEVTNRLNELLREETTICHGLDLGTSCSLWAYKEKDKDPKAADYRGNSRNGIPSLFWNTEDGTEYAGDKVVELNGLAEDPLGVCSSIKMKLNDKAIVLNDKRYRPEEIMTRLIHRILEVSREALSNEYVDMTYDHLVVGVPAKFSAAEKGTIRSILQDTTKCDNIRLVPEPILAALTNNYYTGNTEGSQNTLVYDLGAGTFDICMLRRNPMITSAHPYPYLVTEADGLRIAGDRFDELVEELIMGKLRKNPPPTVNLSILENKEHSDRRNLREIAKTVKETLSSKAKHQAVVTGTECGIGVVEITRDEFEQAIYGEIAKTVELAYDVMKRSNIGEKPEMDIILVGGSTYIPLVKKMMCEKFSWLSENHILQRFPEKAVALGAAVFSEMPQIVDNTPVPFHYAIDTYSNDVHVLDVIIPRGSKLPFSETFSCYSTRYDKQEGILFTVYEIYDEENKKRYQPNEGVKTNYSIEHKFGKQVPEGTNVDLTVCLTEDGVLKMTIDDRGVSEHRVTEYTVSLLHEQ